MDPTEEDKTAEEAPVAAKATSAPVPISPPAPVVKVPDPPPPPAESEQSVTLPVAPYAAILTEVQAAVDRLGVPDVGVQVLPDADGPDGRVMLTGPNLAILREVASLVMAQASAREWQFISPGQHERGACLLLRVAPLA